MSGNDRLFCLKFLGHLRILHLHVSKLEMPNKNSKSSQLFGNVYNYWKLIAILPCKKFYFYNLTTNVTKLSGRPFPLALLSKTGRLQCSSSFTENSSLTHFFYGHICNSATFKRSRGDKNSSSCNGSLSCVSRRSQKSLLKSSAYRITTL